MIGFGGIDTVQMSERTVRLPEFLRWQITPAGNDHEKLERAAERRDALLMNLPRLKFNAEIAR